MSKQDLLYRPILWGASTSAYQVEGGWNQDGKGPSVQDLRTVPEGTTDFTVASDHYNHVLEDVALLKELGLTTYRFSIAWTRLIPDGVGPVNPAGVAFYHTLIDALIEAEIVPIATVYHFDLPLALEKQGGWSLRSTIDAFADYCQLLFDEYGSKVPYWLTINEQNMMTLVGSVLFAGGKTQKQVYQENHHMLVAQAKVMKNYHAGNYPGVIGPAPNIAQVYPKSATPEDQLAASNMNALRNWLYLDAAVYGVYNHQVLHLLKQLDAMPEMTAEDLEIMRDGTADFIALNYYNTMTVEAYALDGQASVGDQQGGMGLPGYFKVVANGHLPKTQFGWEIDPLGFKTTLHEVKSRYHLPIMITENGLGAYDELTEDFKVHDDYRIRYYEDHIKYLLEAKAEGVDLIAYSPWSAIDLVSTHEGIRKRYGFIYVNRDDEDLKDLKRYRKDSFYWYQAWIKAQNQK